jgi:VWFA-related protein
VVSAWSSQAFQNTSVLSQLAASTGGVFFHGSNDLLQQFENVLSDGRDYYLLAYTPANSTADGKFRHIRVKVRGKDRGVRSKLGYWADGAPPR